MNIIFLNNCAVDGCYKKSVKGEQLCGEHKTKYDNGEKLKAFYGKTIQRKSLINKYNA